MPKNFSSDLISTVDPFVLVIFGGTGDLSQKKLFPALYDLFLDGALSKHFAILSVGSKPLSSSEFEQILVDSIQNHSQIHDAESISSFVVHCRYLTCDVNEISNCPILCNGLAKVCEDFHILNQNTIFYLAVPTQLLPKIVEHLKTVKACNNISNSKIIVEKPFGFDAESARKLNAELLNVFPEEQIYRIDHYLGKDTVQNILFFRFGNSIFEPLWSYEHIDHVEITVAEEFGIENRGRFFEGSGIIRDIIQNHALQLLALIAMEMPQAFHSEEIHDKKKDVLKNVRIWNEIEIPQNTVIGQYGEGSVNGKRVKSYRQEQYVDPDSVIPTFMAGRFYIDVPRWKDVPFYIRSGKRLTKTVTKITVYFKRPTPFFNPECGPLMSNILEFQIQPHEKISLYLNVKQLGMADCPYHVPMSFDYDSVAAKRHPAYERLLVDCIRGDAMLFAHADEISYMWQIVDPVIQYWEKHPPQNFPNYQSGSWGPEKGTAPYFQ